LLLELGDRVQAAEMCVGEDDVATAAGGLREEVGGLVVADCTGVTAAGVAISASQCSDTTRTALSTPTFTVICDLVTVTAVMSIDVRTLRR